MKLSPHLVIPAALRRSQRPAGSPESFTLCCCGRLKVRTDEELRPLACDQLDCQAIAAHHRSRRSS
jgi:hypothetical protein